MDSRRKAQPYGNLRNPAARRRRRDAHGRAAVDGKVERAVVRRRVFEREDVFIRRTLAPVIGNARLMVRFEVPREIVSDNVAHNVLRIIRELVTNAVNHGKATKIRIAGSVDANFLHFSVADNGCGFDPESCPGAQQGHFGRQGIRERVKRLGGTVETTSSPGNGAKVTVAVDLGIHDEEDPGL